MRPPWRTLLLVYVLLLPLTVRAASADAPAQEYRVKAAFLHKFLQFVSLGGKGAGGRTAILGILGKDPFGGSFDAVDGESIPGTGRRLEVRRLGRTASDEELRRCALLFIARSEKHRVAEILEQVRGYPVLTVSETAGFVEEGGMLNLVVRDRKVRWEVNYDAVEKAGLRLNSQILRNAVRILKGRGE